MLFFNGWAPKLKDRVLGRSVYFLQYLFVGIFNAVVAVIVFGVLGKSFSVPWISSGDGELNLILVRNIQRTGWLFENPNLGAPGKSHIYDLPQGGENLQFLTMKFIGLFTNASATLNIYFIFTFSAVAMFAFGAAKWWGLRPLTAFLISSLYAFLPYHFFRGEGHLLLSMYAFLPIVIVYCFKSTEKKIELKKWQWVIFALLASSINSYYTVFSLVLIGMALIFNLIRRSKINVAQQLWLMGSIIGLFIVNQMPSILYILQNGKNNVVADRGYDGAEVYGLQITDMFLPRSGHRIEMFSKAGTAVSKAGLRSELGQALGIVTSLGLVALILYGVFKMIRQEPIDQKFHFPFLLVMSLILLTVSSSVTLLLGMARFTDIRSWNRVVIIIGFIGLLFFGYLLEKLIENKKLSILPTIALVAIIFIVGILDQTSNDDRIQISSSSKTFKNECELVKKIGDKEVRNQLVFQLPFVQFPEASSSNGLGPYHQGLATLCPTSLKFSFGATRGRDDGFQRRIGSKFNCDSDSSCSVMADEIKSSIDELREARFSALMIYQNGYADHGKAIEKLLKFELGKPIGDGNSSVSAFLLES